MVSPCRAGVLVGQGVVVQGRALHAAGSAAQRTASPVVIPGQIERVRPEMLKVVEDLIKNPTYLQGGLSHPLFA